MHVTYSQWQEDTAVLRALRTGWNDKLEVNAGGLHLEKGLAPRQPGVAIISRPLAVADHIQTLVGTTAQECFRAMQTSASDTPEFYEQVAAFKSQLKCLSSRVSDLQCTFRVHDCGNEAHAQRYSQLFELAHAFLEQVKTYKASLTKPPVSERPVKHVDYDERTELRSIRWSYPQRVPVAETVAAAQKALLLAQPKPQSLPIKCLKFIGTAILLAPAATIAGMLTLAKIVLWNPIEWLVRGEVRTPSPLNLLAQGLRSHNDHMRAYQSFTTQLMHCPIITEEVAVAFEQLAPQADLLDLEKAVLACRDIVKLAPFMAEDTRPRAIPVATYLSTMQRLCKQKNIELQTLYAVKHLYQCANDLYLNPKRESQSVEAFFDDFSDKLNKKSDSGKACAVHSYVSPGVLQRLLTAAISSPTCCEITLSAELDALPPVQALLAQHAYRLKEGSDYAKTYCRYPKQISW